MNRIPYHRYLTTQFSIAYDVYLEILWCVKQQVDAVLSCNTLNWRIQNSCPCCQYRLEAEPALVPLRIAVDGNNSLRRVDASLTKGTNLLLDSRTTCKDLWLTYAQVNVFENEVKAKAKSRKKPSLSQPPINTQEPLTAVPSSSSHRSALEDGRDEDELSQDDEDDTWLETGEPGDVMSSADAVTVCIKCWKNAGPEERKKMWEMFDETGVFIAVCRHGFLLIMCDMVKSGKLAKYGLAITDKILEALGDNIGEGDDIGCAFASTVNSSILLGDKACQRHLRMIVLAFHGHAHNRSCQLSWHPLYIPGLGLEDFETCERVFLQSNHLAAVTWHTSAFHCHQAIEEWAGFWDEDKYANLSKFLLDNYKQVLELVTMLAPALESFKRTYELTDADFQRFYEQKKRYLATLKVPPENMLEISYVEALEAFELAGTNKETARVAFNGIDHIIITQPNSRTTKQQITLLKTQHTNALNKLDDRRDQLTEVESKLGISPDCRWTHDHPRRQATATWMSHADYNRVLDKLEWLIVMRLFELTKLNHSGTGYALCVHIAHALKKRCKTIQRALQQYNKQAGRLNPPQPPLDWKTVVEFTFLAEFDLLRFGRQDIRNEQWASPGIREATTSYFKLQWAREELIRCNIEVQQLGTFIHDECIDMLVHIECVQMTNPTLAYHIRRHWELRVAVNHVHDYRLSQIWHLLVSVDGEIMVSVCHVWIPPHRQQEKRCLTPLRVSALRKKW
ncbi:hypothetical protein K439DRAFT_1638825 [Ramaria rubella]|nr:hypothetical protein K439DRAFT_1638825 [Ramaria rubella]